ncbi:hypothetical protein BC937DRAFT_94844 [Endogone sp. FLAS-F59071]|nr:hypothetical protein BC937DRAFT_94844 [Endogone sp. FLAS-F59071]|eukprot:RUS13740.1 hypothetical protein BC937DRAFT_94844 [Endogone sp. FLAS-F59071]
MNKSGLFCALTRFASYSVTFNPLWLFTAQMRKNTSYPPMDIGHNSKKIKTYGKKRTDRIVCLSAWDNNLDPSKSPPLPVASNAETVRNGRSLKQHDKNKENAVDMWDERILPIASRPPEGKPAKPRAEKVRPPKKDAFSPLAPSPSRHTKRAVRPTRITKVAKLHYDTPRTPLAPKHTNILALEPNAPTFKNLTPSSPLKARHTTTHPTLPSPFAPDVCSTPNTHVDSLSSPPTATPDARSAPRFRTPLRDSPPSRRRTSTPISTCGEDRLELSTSKGDEGRSIQSSSFLALPLSPFSSLRPPILPASVPISPILAVTSSTPISSTPISSTPTVASSSPIFIPSTPPSASDVDSLVESMGLRLSIRRSRPEIVAPHLRQLLEECGQRRVGSFEEMLGEATLAHATKLGEATFAEVFSIPSEFISSTSSSTSSLALSPSNVSRLHTHEHPLVLKIVPFGSGDRILVNGLPQAECEDVLQEIVVTRGMAGVEGFIGVEKVAVCCGTYPERLLQEWDRWDEEKGSENDRPDYFPSTQLYCVLVLEHGGSDLEHVKLRNWRQAAAVFWQVATAIAVGEEVSMR